MSGDVTRSSDVMSRCTFGLESAAGGVCELITTVIVHCLALGREGGIFKLERASLERFPAVPHLAVARARAFVL